MIPEFFRARKRVSQRGIILLCLALVLVGVGCAGKRRVATKPRVKKVYLPPPSAKSESRDERMLEEIIRGQPILPAEIGKISDRMLAEGSVLNERALALLEIVLTKSLNGAPQEVRHRLLRNLGIIHYHQKKFHLARQELQQANELFPRDGRTHFYLARLAAHQGQIYQRQGLSKKAQGQFNLAANEMELAQKLEPSNDFYRQDLRKVLEIERNNNPSPKR
jgi:Flp pilus assembly protein TadD